MKTGGWALALLLAVVAGTGSSTRSVPAGTLDLTRAVVVAPPGTAGAAGKAIDMLVDEVEERTGIRWQRAGAWPGDDRPVVAIGPAGSLRSFAGAAAPEMERAIPRQHPEGFLIRTRPGPPAPAVIIAGTDARGVLYGAGRLLRSLRMEPGKIELPEELSTVSWPRTAVRGHQLGYRPKTNSYDAWTPEMWEDYIRDLAIFGVNAVELIPPRSDDAATSPHFPLPPMEMMIRMSRLLDAYGLDVWIWYPALDADYSNPETVQSALKEWGDVFRQLPRVDDVFVPGGDPGHTAPGPLMALLEKQAAVLRQSHPKARMWLSPQGFSAAWMDELAQYLARRQPEWLAGIVYGPQVRMSLPRLRKLVPSRYPIRHYPDITHSLRCQYPVPDWDLAYALTEGREGINPRPLGMARIFAATNRDTIGFLTYSEGCNDDVNKVVWSALGWDPDATVIDVLRDYSRLFIGPELEDSFAQGLLALERNWEGPLLTNGGVETTLAQFQAMERGASPRLLKNWRFQQALYRAYYDATTRARLIYETDLEQQALAALRSAPQTGSTAAMDRAAAILGRAAGNPVAQDTRARVFELAEALFRSIRMQLSVSRYQAIAVDRGANLDTIDAPLNNRPWLLRRFEAARQLADEAARRRAIEAILQRSNPGPGGFYDEPGNPARRLHVVPGPGPELDPGSFEGPRCDFATPGLGPTTWARFAETLYDTPFTMRYAGLDPRARYRLRVVYGPDNPQVKIRIVMNGTTEISPFLTKPTPQGPVAYLLPPIGTSALTLRWIPEPGAGGNGRICQLGEVWLARARE